MKKVIGRFGNEDRHWVGDGFPVRTVFSYNDLAKELSPFLLLDYAGPAQFPPTNKRLGVGEHPHRGFETVTIVYDGEVEHRDSAGAGGVIGPGDVQWMTAAGGLIHEEFHSRGFARTGGPFKVVQLWVNLPAKDKMARPGYQPILSTDIPTVALDGGAGSLRVIAGEHRGTKGPARTFTPINVWDAKLRRGAETTFDLPDGHTAILVVLSGHVTLASGETAGPAEVLLLDKAGQGASLGADADTELLILTGEPIDEPIAGYGPFVMNTDAEIRQAIDDFNSGRFGQIAAA
jgi:redox-sensitive bicupin YhaK (pirin superfamily)